MGILSENGLRSGLDDAIDEISIVHAPLAKPSDRLAQLVAIIREPIFRFRRHVLIDGVFQKPVTFEVAQSLDQNLLGNICDLLLQLVEASMLPYRLAVKHDSGPLVSDFNSWRPHRAIGQRASFAVELPISKALDGEVIGELGGLHHVYHLAA
jgi:hypothetical protein